MEVISIAVAFLIGMIVGYFCFKKKPEGTLRIDHSNPEKDIYRFEIDDLDKLNSKTRVVLNIDHKAHIR